MASAGEGIVVGELAVFTAHLIKNDRMPGGVALRRRNVILAGPAAEARPHTGAFEWGLPSATRA